MFEQLEALLKVSWWIVCSGLFPLHELAKDPGVRQCAATDRDGGTTSLLEHRGGVGERANVAFTHNRDPRDSLDHAANSVAIDLAFESLFARAAVNRDGRDSHLLELRGELRCGDLRTVPAEPHLHRHG